MFYAYFQASGSTLTQQLSQYVAGIARAFLFQFHSRYLSPKPKNPSFSWRENFFWSFMYMYPLEFVEKHHHRLLTKRELNSLLLKVI